MTAILAWQLDQMAALATDLLTFTIPFNSDTPRYRLSEKILSTTHDHLLLFSGIIRSETIRDLCSITLQELLTTDLRPYHDPHKMSVEILALDPAENQIYTGGTRSSCFERINKGTFIYTDSSNDRWAPIVHQQMAKFSNKKTDIFSYFTSLLEQLAEKDPEIQGHATYILKEGNLFRVSISHPPTNGLAAKPFKAPFPSQPRAPVV
ncbi:hypothetical protein CMO92_02470 [Candidatus Woesearchaeota archaeon]|nr:hypothetical protein [Candidatus Woesearchaeota archaeon]